MHTPVEVRAPVNDRELIFYRGPLRPHQMGPMLFSGVRRLWPVEKVKICVPRPRDPAAWRDYYRFADLCQAEGCKLHMDGSFS